MTDSERCGSTDTGDGTPCENPACREDGLCWIHTETTDGHNQGRPSKLTHARQEGIAQMIEQGRSMNSACRQHNIDPTTAINWMQRGEAEMNAGKDNEYTDFFQRITRAKGAGEEWYMQIIMDLAREQNDHRFIASLMKQRYPESWGKTETGVEGSNIEIVLNPDEEDVRQLEN